MVVYGDIHGKYFRWEKPNNFRPKISPNTDDWYQNQYSSDLKKCIQIIDVGSWRLNIY